MRRSPPVGRSPRTVTDAASHAAVVGLEVDVYDTSGDYVYEGATCTGANGSYTVSSLPTGSYWVGFATGATSANCASQGAGYVAQFYNDEPESNTPDAVSVTAGSTTSNINAALQALGAISGTVTDASSHGDIANVEVDVFDASGGFIASACTGSNGTYMASPLPAGSYSVGFATNKVGGCGGPVSTGYQPQYYDDEPSLQTATPVSVGSGVTNGIGASLTPDGALSGTVTDTLGHGLAEVEVDVLNATSGTFISGACTRSGGTYTVPALPPGSYEVDFESGENFVSCGSSTAGYVEGGYYNGKRSLSAADLVSVTEGSTTPGINASLTVDGQITGTVTNTSSAPLADVEVDLFNASGGVVDATCTASNGTYTLSFVSPGSERVGFATGRGDASCGSSAADYLPQYDGGVSSLQMATAVTVTAEATTTAVSASLTLGGSITGTVTDTSSQGGIANVEVDVFDATSGAVVAAACTGSGGNYTVAAPAGNYKVGFATGLGDASCGSSAADYLTQYDGEAPSLAAATTVGVTTGSTQSAVNASLTLGGLISGAIEPAVANVEVDVFAVSTGDVVDATCTAANGTYTTSALAPGSYTVGFATGLGDGSCASSATTYLPTYYASVSSLSAATAVTVTAGSTKTGIDAALMESGQISGMVSASGSPVAGIEVDVFDPTGAVVDATCTGSTGTYTVTVAIGNYRVGFATGLGQAACGSPPVTYVPQYDSGVSSLSSATPVTVMAASATSDIDASLQQAGQISGAVNDLATGHAVGNVEVDVFSVSGTVIGATCTDPNGLYRVTALPAGSYNVGFATGLRRASCASSTAGYLAQYFRDEAALSAADLVSVTAGSTTTAINASLQQGGQISGTVTDAATGSPISNIDVELYDSSGDVVAETCTRLNGTYTIPALTGTYDVGFATAAASTCGPDDDLPQYYSAASSRATATEVTVTAVAAVPAIDAKLRDGGAISGTVTDAASGNPVENIPVYALDASGTLVGDACTSASGNYTLDPLPVASYKVEFATTNTATLAVSCGGSLPAYANQYYKGASSLAAATAVAVTAGATTTAINAAMPLAGKIVGTVTAAAGGAHLAGISVQVYDSSGTLAAAAVDTNSAGAYTLSGLAPETTRLGSAIRPESTRPSSTADSRRWRQPTRYR